MMRLGWNAQDTSARIRGMAKIAALVFLALYIFIYLREPFSDVWNNILTNLLLVIAASAAAAVATRVWRQYEQADPPRRIWWSIALGLWVWAAAELTWGYLYVTRGEVSVGIADIFWVAAYLFFAHALFVQYKLLVQPDNREWLRRVALAIVAMLVLYFLLYWVLTTWMAAESQLDAIVNSFYPIADLFLASIAIWLIRHFRGGAFARPWLGLLAFSFTDLLYAWIETSGIYEQASVWTVLFDTSYVAAYLLLGLGILSQWAFLKYGLRSDN